MLDEPADAPADSADQRPARRRSRAVLACIAGLAVLLAVTVLVLAPGDEPDPVRQADPVPGAGTWSSGAAGVGVASGEFAEWRGRPVDIAATWADDVRSMTQLAQLEDGAEYGSWTGDLDVAIGAIGPDESWAEAATGEYDERWRASLERLRDNWGDRPGQVYLRFAHEMNGNWYPWSVDADSAEDFVEAWRRFRGLQLEIFPEAKLVFCVNRESVDSGIDWRETFPGAEHVDVMGVDYYNQFPYVDDAEGWAKSLDDKDQWGAPKGLAEHLEFARSVGLPLALPEWSGNADNGDSPAFIEGMYSFFQEHGGTGPGQVLYEILFNVGHEGGSTFLLFGDEARMPESADTYRSLW